MFSMMMMAGETLQKSGKKPMVGRFVIIAGVGVNHDPVCHPLTECHPAATDQDNHRTGPSTADDFDFCSR
jgi:hypothetical protein